MLTFALVSSLLGVFFSCFSHILRVCIHIEDQGKCDKNNLRCRTWVLKEKVREIWGLKQADLVIFNFKKIKRIFMGQPM